MAPPQPHNSRQTCTICHRTLVNKWRLLEHERRHTGEKPHVCEMCPKSFVSTGDLHRHHGTHTGEKPYSCTICTKSFVSSQSLKIHKRWHTGEKPFSCDLCQARFQQQSNLTSHKKAHTGVRPFSCSLCDKKYTSKMALDRHLRCCHTGEKPFCCTDTDCNRRFYSFNELQRHKKVFHLSPAANDQAVIHECQVCHRQLTSLEGIRRHKKAMHQANQLKHACEECGKTFKSRQCLVQHQNHNHVRKEPLNCSFCAATFKTRLKLTDHVRRHHTNEKAHCCPAPGCDAKFYTITEMKNHHKRIHLKEKPHACPEPNCGQRFFAKERLMSHRRRHHHTGEKPYKCGACDKSYWSYDGFKSHTASHLAEKPYACPWVECGALFKVKGRLAYHELTRHGKGPGAGRQECPVCKKLVLACSFKDHQTTHAENRQRSFKCEMCPKSYYSMGHLNVHLKGHGPKTQVCTFCEKAFHTKQYLIDHMRSHTGEKPVPVSTTATAASSTSTNYNFRELRVVVQQLPPLPHLSVRRQ